MSGRQTIKQRIAFEGGEAMKAQLEALGEVGEKAFKKISDAARQADFAKFGGALHKVGSDFVTVARRAALGFAAIQSAVGAAAPVVMLLAKSGANAAEQASKAAQATGLQTQSYQKLAFAAESAGASQEQFTHAMSKFSREIIATADKAGKAGQAIGRNVKQSFGFTTEAFEEAGVSVTRFGDKVAAAGDKARNGSSSTQTAFQQLGIAIRDASGKLKNNEQLLREVADAFARMPDGARKSALAIKFFGQAGDKLIPFLNKGSKGIDELGQKAEELGILFSDDQIKAATEFNDTLLELKKSLASVLRQIGLIFAPSIATGARAFRDAITRNRKALLEFVDGAVRRASVLVRDFFAAMSGRDADVQTAWIIEWRDAILRFGQDAYSVAHGVVLPAFELLRKAAGGVTDAINKLFGTDLSGGQLLLGATLLKLIGGFELLGSTVMLAVRAVTLLSRVFWAHPWTAVLAAVATGIGLWVTRTDGATAAMEKHRGMVDSAAEAYEKVGRKIEEISQLQRDEKLLELRGPQERLAAQFDTAMENMRSKLKTMMTLAEENNPFAAAVQAFIDGGSLDALKEAVVAIGKANPDFDVAANKLLAMTNALMDTRKEVQEGQNWIDLYARTITDAEFASRQAALGVAGYTNAVKNSNVEVKAAGEAAQQTNAKVEELGKTITVTKFGDGGPVKQVYELADGVARAVDQSKTSLDELVDGSDRAEKKIAAVGERVATVVRSVPQELRGQTTPAEALTEGLDEAGTRVQQAATEISTATATAKQGVEALGESWVETNRQAASALSEMPDSAKAAVDALAAEVSRIPAIMAEVQGSQALADAILEPFQKLVAAIDGIMAGIRDTAQNGFTSLIGIVRQLAGEIDAMIARVITALRQAAAEAAKLRASGASSSSTTKTKGFAGGGRVWGPGTGTSDSILARLSNGEFVARAKAVAYYGPGLFNALNNLQLPKDFLKGLRGFNLGGMVDGIRSSLSSFDIPRFADGGLVNALAPAGASGTPLILQMPDGQMISGITASDNAVSQLKRHAAGKAMTSAGRKPGWYR